MDRSSRADRILTGLMDELADARTPDYLEAAIERASSRPQRPAWTLPERWLPMADIASRPAYMPRVSWRTIGVALVIIALVLVGTVVFIGSRQTRLPAPFGPAANGLIPYESNGDIYVGDPVSGTSRLVIGGPEDDRGPSFSADGTWIGFLRHSVVGRFDIYVVRQDGRDLRRVTSEPISNQSWVEWAPDSRHIATVRQVQTTGCPTTVCFTQQLDLFDVAGDASETIATADRMDYVQFRPPDGRELLYRALIDGKWGLFAMDADGSNKRAIVPPTVPGEMDMSFSSAVYSADGSRIFYEHGDEGGCCQLWVVNADGTDPHQFLPLGPAWDGQAKVSPDGTRVAYWHNLNDGPAHGIAVVRTDGAGPVVDTGPKLSGTAHWVWAPDSSKILMYPDDGSANAAYMIDPAGGTYTTVPWQSGDDLDWQRIAPPG